jgi:cytochrome c oxidase subunit I
MLPVSTPAAAAPAAVAEAGQAALRRELGLWVVLAVAALGIAGLFAFLLAFSRIPGIEAIFPWPIGFFHKGLVIHVVFSFVVWFLAVFGAMTLLASHRLSDGRPRLDGLGLIAVTGSMLALPLLFVPAFLDRGEPTLNNYVPVIIDPLYYAGLGLLAASIGCAALRLLVSIRTSRLRIEPIAATVAAAAVVYLLALLCFGLARQALAGVPWSHAFNEEMMWGGGHVLQFVNTLLLVAVWALLAQPFLDRLPVRALAASSGLLLLAAVPAPSFSLSFPAFSAEQMHAFTWLQYALGPAAAVLAVALPGRLRRPWPWHEPAFLALALSMLLFAVGGTLGLFVDGADTRTPAHYHGVIAGVTLAFFGLFFARFLPLLGRRLVGGRRLRVILHVFAWGQLAACIGLFIAGGHGAPRKVAGDAQGLSDMAAMVGMGLNGLGGLVAVVGGILFVWTVAAALLRAPEPDAATAGLRS